jgi:7-keto-8-aminopelargonate synthetase-like enzyme
MDAGVYTNPIVSPAVPQGRALLRTSYMATHTRKQLEFCLDMFEKIGRKARIIR